jgi:predicted AAA+ superfamily ATPase
MGIHDYQNLTLNPKLGASWEGFALEEILRLFQPDDIYFWKIHSGPELDLLCFKDSKRIGFEIKYADAPKLTHSMKKAFELLKLDKLYVVHPGKHSYLLAQNIEVITLSELL